MPIDKTWATIENRNSDEFSRGLESFVERSKAHVDGRGLIRCPCRKCVITEFVKISVMKAHIQRFGFSRRYITWVYHGETIAPTIVDDVAPRNEMAGVIDDVMGENDTNHDNEDSDTEASVVDDGFSQLLDEVNAELYPGCTWFSSLDFLAKLMNIKNALVRELAEQTQLSATSSNPTPVDEPAIFEKVLGSRRGHIKGIGHKPSARTNSSSYSEGHSYTSPHTHVQPELDVEAILSNPAFRAGIVEILQSLTSQNDSGGSENRRNERDEENDDNNGD